MLFDDFVENRKLGESRYQIRPDLVAQWRALYGRQSKDGAGGRIPIGFLPIIKMRAYMEACPVRPPGNIHGEQSYDIGDLPRIGDTVVTDVECAGKELRSGRRWIHIRTRTYDGESGREYATGTMKIAWAR